MIVCVWNPTAIKVILRSLVIFAAAQLELGMAQASIAENRVSYSILKKNRFIIGN